MPATEAAHFPRVLALAARFPSLYAALGLHPIVIERHADDDSDKLQQALAQQQNVVAVGEIGSIFIATTRSSPGKGDF